MGTWSLRAIGLHEGFKGLEVSRGFRDPRGQKPPHGAPRENFRKRWATSESQAPNLAPRVQVPNNHILSKILTYITTILNPST